MKLWSTSRQPEFTNAGPGSSGGVLSGTPTMVGSFPITVSVHDSIGQDEVLIEVPEFLETDTFLVQGTTKEVGKFEGGTMNRNVIFFWRTVSRSRSYLP